ncbi:hypothetical protein Q7P37_002143 [Cladosporium fusiforme]
MATLAPSSPPTSPPFHRRRRSWARKVERVCCQTISYFPLLFVYGLTTWSVWVAINVSFFSGSGWAAYVKAGGTLALYIMADVSYTIAVFTDPGSPLDPRSDAAGRRKDGGYEGLPTYEDDEPEIPRGMSTVTAKQSGKPRYCKKCRCVKPDRSHHCSTCGKCVLKMDHHCPWLATCAGLRNYKPFLLFLIYTSIFCWACFGVSAWWVWMEIAEQAQMEEGMRVVNTILLAVLGGIIGLVLSGFTGWHLYLTATGQTTIESLEKTRYLSPLRRNMEHQLHAHRNYVGDDNNSDPHPESQTITEHLKEIHANALPGVLRPEEGESSSPSPQPPFERPSTTSTSSPAHSHLRQSYASLEAQREHERYDAYLDEQDSEKLPNAFDIGWRRNVLHVFGENPLYWFLPICNSTGDGWMWEVSPKWTQAQEDVTNQRLQWQAQQAQQQQSQQIPSFQPPAARNWRWTASGFVDRPTPAPPRVSGHSPDGMGSEMQPIDRNRGVSGDRDEYETSSDEDVQRGARKASSGGAAATENWNDVPDDFLSPKGPASHRVRSSSRGRRKGD